MSRGKQAPRCNRTTADGSPCMLAAVSESGECSNHMDRGDHERRCTAKTRAGTQCKLWALKGLNVCKYHGGAPKSVREVGLKRHAKQQAMKKLAKQNALFAAKVEDADPGTQLLELVRWTAGEVMFWREEVRALAEEKPDRLTWGVTKETHLGPESAAGLPVAYQALTAAQDRLAHYCSVTLKAGVEERRVRLAEQQGDLVVTVIQRILEALDLTPEQAERVPEIVPRELRLVTAGA